MLGWCVPEQGPEVGGIWRGPGGAVCAWPPPGGCLGLRASLGPFNISVVWRIWPLLSCEWLWLVQALRCFVFSKAFAVFPVGFGVFGLVFFFCKSHAAL